MSNVVIKFTRRSPLVIDSSLRLVEESVRTVRAEQAFSELGSVHLLRVVLPAHDLLGRRLVQHGVAPLQIASDLRRAKSLALLNKCLIHWRSGCHSARHRS